MRHPFVLRGLALGALAGALWLAPGPGHRGAPRPTPPAANAAPAAPDEVKTPRPPAAPPPPDTVFTLGPAASTRAYAVALDELYFPRRPAAARLASIPAHADLAALLAYAATLPAPAPRLVLYPASGPRNTATRRILNPGLEIGLASPTSPTPAPRPDLGIVAWERPAYAPDRALARIVGDPAQPLRAAAALASTPGVAFARPLLARQWSRKLVPNDPLFKDQWHLRNTGQQSGLSGIDIRAVPAWDTATGSGVVIGIVDDGLDYAHPDLAPAYDASLGHDWNGDDSDPAPEQGGEEGDDHGTAVAGLAAARGGNSVGVVGAAPSATLASLRLISSPTDDAEDAQAMAWRNDAILVKNNSWGPPDAYGSSIPPDLYPAGSLWRAAILDAVARGRDGLGTLFIWSAGNGQADADQGSKDGYAALRQVIPVAAVTNRGTLASFSEGGPHLVVAAPGDAIVGLVTTDRLGDLGYNTITEAYPGDYITQIDYTKAFAGTSAAAPVVSGVAALLLQARPDLGWRDVKEILLRSSTRLQAGSTDWTTRAAGDAARPIKHHPRLGGGLVDARAALQLARAWTPLAPEATLSTGLLSRETAIPDAGSPLVVDAPSFPRPDDPATPDPLILRVEHVELTLDITHPFRGDLELKLTSPAGVTSIFTVPTKRDFGPDYKNIDGSAGYTFTSVRHWGEASIGPRAWRVSVRDAYRRDLGTLHSVVLSLHGTPITAPALVADLAPLALATGSTLVLSAAFSGGNLDYRWTRDGEPIPDATSPVYRLDNYTARAAGSYACVATNAAGSASTASVAVTVDDSPRAVIDLRAGAAVDLALVPGDAPRGWKASGLPAGLGLDPATGRLLGRPAKTGAHQIVVSATDAEGITVRTPLTLVVSPVPPGLTGDYVALVAREPVLNADLGGSLTLAISANGTATGSLVLGRATHAFSGFLDGQGGDDPVLTATLSKPGLRLALRIVSTPEGQTLVGTLTGASPAESPPSAGLVGARAAWKKSTLPATAYVGACAYALAPSDTPALGLGASIATLKVAADGRVSWLLTPADGAPALSGSGRLTDHGTLLLHAPYKSDLGSFSGTLAVPATDDPAPLELASVDWLRKPAPSLARPAGFGPESLAAIPGGGRHLRPAAGVRILGLAAAAPALDALLAPSVLGLETPARLDAAITVTSANLFTVATPNSPRLKLAFDPVTGRVTGSYTLADPKPAAPAQRVLRTVKLHAIVLPGASHAVGFALTPPTFTSAAPVSAALELAPAATE